MAGVAAFAIARFNSRRVRLISWWLRMTLMRRDIATILSSIESSASSNLKIIYVTRGGAVIFQLIARSGACSRLARNTCSAQGFVQCRAGSAKPYLGDVRIRFSGVRFQASELPACAGTALLDVSRGAACSREISAAGAAVTRVLA